MFVNYMDYSSDAHVTMFTKGQNEVMNETLEGLYDEDQGFRVLDLESICGQQKILLYLELPMDL